MFIVFSLKVEVKIRFESPVMLHAFFDRLLSDENRFSVDPNRLVLGSPCWFVGATTLSIMVTLSIVTIGINDNYNMRLLA
jgi:hypothetical protein